MQLVLELLKKIFVALQGVYTKQETDAALAEIDLQRVIDAQSSRNVVMSNILTIAKAPVDNVHPVLLMGDFSFRFGTVNTTTGQISGFVNETMPQGDGTFVVTNRVSGGPLDLSEDGTAPNHAVSLGQLTAEAQAREQADAALDAKIEANTANDNALTNVVKWQSYAAAMQSMVDETAAAQIAEEFERATNEYLADPTATKEWVTTKNADGTITSTCPYYDAPPTKPVVDLNVNKVEGVNLISSFNVDIDESIFLPNAVHCNGALFRTKFNKYLILPSARNVNDLLASTLSYDKPLFLPAAVNCRGLLYGNLVFSSTLYIPNAVLCVYLLYNAKSFNHYLYLPHCSSADSGFTRTAMSAENISKTLDSLPTWTDGESHVITFTGSPGAAHVSTTETITIEIDGQTYTFENFPRFTMDDENETLRYSVARATAKGWEVQMGNPQ